MDKYAVVPEEDACTHCNGTGRTVSSSPAEKNSVRKQYAGSTCTHCSGTGRKTGKINPAKEADHLKKEQENG